LRFIFVGITEFFSSIYHYFVEVRDWDPFSSFSRTQWFSHENRGHWRKRRGANQKDM
jgi:hypothetical protein